MTTENFQARNTAFKVKIREIIDKKPSRINLIGIAVSEHNSNLQAELLIDDGQDKIVVRNFNNYPGLEGLNIGDAVLVIGRPREFNNEIYIAAEIIRVINPLWIKVRDKEIENGIKIDTLQSITTNNDIISLIKNLDQGNGVMINNILNKAGGKNNGDIKLKIDLMIKKGDIFEVSPGRLKVLE